VKREAAVAQTAASCLTGERARHQRSFSPGNERRTIRNIGQDAAQRAAVCSARSNISVSTGRGKKPRSSTANVVSLALFGLAAILFIVVAVLYIRDERDKEETPPVPTAAPGRAQLINVVEALENEDIDVEVSRDPGPRFENLTPPGQGLTAGGNPLYVFIYEDTTIRDDETSSLEPADLTAVDRNGTPVPGTPHGVGHGNVFVVLFGGDDDLIAKVDTAINGIH
jgi:hypothetical protein